MRRRGDTAMKRYVVGAALAAGFGYVDADRCATAAEAAPTDFDHVSIMFRSCFNHVSIMFQLCSDHVSSMFRARCVVGAASAAGAGYVDAVRCGTAAEAAPTGFIEWPPMQRFFSIAKMGDLGENMKVF